MAFSTLTRHAAMRFQELAKDKTKGCRCKSMHGEPPHGHSSTAQVEMWRSGGETSWVLDLKPPQSTGRLPVAICLCRQRKGALQMRSQGDPSDHINKKQPTATAPALCRSLLTTPSNSL